MAGMILNNASEQAEAMAQRPKKAAEQAADTFKPPLV
jgi:hypothetical protein